jgi:hypothetical protein
MPGPRYLSRRVGRSQNGSGDDLSVAGGAAPDSPERPAPSPENHPLPPLGRDPDPAPDPEPDVARPRWRTGGWGLPPAPLPEAPFPDAPLPDAPFPVGLGAGADLAGLLLAVPARAAEPRAQPADAPSGADPPRDGSGSGGAARPEPPASGHCLPRPEAAPPVPAPVPAPFPPVLPSAA